MEMRKRSKFVKTFLQRCSQFGVQSLANRNAVIKRSIAGNYDDTVVFLACGYDFIFEPSDRKFERIIELFVQSKASHPLNIGPQCISIVQAMMQTPQVAVSYEGSGVAVGLSRSGQGRGGLKERGVGNYNLQTKALEFIVTSKDHGIDKQKQLDALLDQIRAGTTPVTFGRTHQVSYDEWKKDVTVFWGEAGAKNVGFP
jgi:hypothetical protein